MADGAPTSAAVRKPANTQSTCRYHCCACNAHFKSLTAFDAHRIDVPGGRACSDPDSIAGLYVQRIGTCDLMVHGTRIRGADLWSWDGALAKAARV